MSGKFSKGTRETSRQRKRGEESDEAIVAGKRGNARGYPPSRRRVAKRCPSRGAKGLCVKKGRCKSNGEKNNVERLQ